MNLHIVDSGSGPAKTIVFLHGFPFNHTMWRTQAAVLNGRFRTVLYDHRGHGQSEVGSGQYLFEFFVDDLLALLDRLQIQKTYLCGLSMGGYMALRAAERAMDRIEGLILCDTRCEADSNEAKLKRAKAVRTIEEKGVSAFCEDFLKACFSSYTYRENPALVADVREMIMSTPVPGIIGTSIALATRTDTSAILPKLKVPTLILVGEDDSITPPEAAKTMQTLLPRAELHTIPHAGHLSNLENPDAFNKYFVDFLRRQSA